MSINKCFLSGNLTRDPELRATQGGMAILSFGIAVNERRKNQQTGAWEDRANYFDCNVFGNRATSLSNILTKGMKVSIEGKLRWSSWEKDGQRRSKIEVIVDEIELPARGSGQQAPQAPMRQQMPQGAPRQGYQAPMQQAPMQQQMPQQQMPQQQMPQQQMPQMQVQQPMAPQPAAPQQDFYDGDIPF